VGDGAGQPHRAAPLRLDDEREIDLARVRAGRLTERPEQIERVARDDPRVSVLYRAYIRDEVLGPIGMPVDEEALASEAPPLELVPPRGEMLLVSLDREPVAIGGVRDLDTAVAEVKSMYVAPAGRGRGIAKRLLGQLEAIAAEHGCRAVRLDTASHLTAAIALYRGVGYHEIPAYNSGPVADFWFERALS
jgi:ribosomal protein S18 acetylase RimI-like enzyme